MQEGGEKKPNSIFTKFIGNTGWMMFRNIYSMLISLIVGSLSARYLGPSNFGLINYGSSIIAFFTTVSKLGMDSVVVVEMARRPEKEDAYLGSALVMRLLTSILSFFLIWGIVVVLEPDNKLLQIVTILQSISIIFQSAEVLYFWFQVRMEMKYVTIASIVALTVTGVWRILLLANQATVQWFALSASISALVSGVCIFVFYYRYSRIKLIFNRDDAKYILENSYHFIINGLAVTLYMQLDKIMLGKVVSSEAVGFYAAASTIAAMWEFVPTAIVNSCRPLLAKEYEKDRVSFTRYFEYLLLGITMLGLLVGIGFTLMAKVFVFVLYGKKYAPAVPALAILIWSTSFAMIGNARGVWIVSERLNKYAKWFTIHGAIVNAILNAIVIPIYSVTGAAVTTLISQVVVAIISPALFTQTRSFVKMYFHSFALVPEMLAIAKNYISKNGSR